MGGEQPSNSRGRHTRELSLLVVAEHFPSAIQPYVLNTIEVALRFGARVTVVAEGQQGGPYPKRAAELGLSDQTLYLPVNSLGDLARGLRPYAVPFSLKGIEAYKGLRRLVSSRRWRVRGFRPWGKALVRARLLGGRVFHLMHAHYLYGAYEYLCVARVWGIPILTTFHGLPPPGIKNLPAERAATIFKYGDLFLVNTQFAKKQLERLGCPPTKIRILPQGLRIEDHPYHPRPFPNETPVVLLTVARLSPDKGLEYAIQAVGGLVERGRRIEYRIVGSGPQRSELENLVRTQRLEKYVRFLGVLDELELRRQYEEAHIFILPSVRDRIGYHEETQGVVLQEAQASGTIVVATQTGGIPECVDDGRSAFLVPDRDSEALAIRIAWVLDHPQSWEVWQREARAWVETHFAMQRIGYRMCEIYQELVEKMSPSASSEDIRQKPVNKL